MPIHLTMMRTLHLPSHRAHFSQSIAGSLNFLRRGRRLAVPFEFALKFGNAFGRNGIGDDDRRLVEDRVRLADSAVDVAEIVAVYFLHMPVPGAPFISQRIQ